jgi:hypothetical protein
MGIIDGKARERRIMIVITLSWIEIDDDQKKEESWIGYSSRKQGLPSSMCSQSVRVQRRVPHSDHIMNYDGSKGVVD